MKQHPIVTQLECLLADLSTQASAREMNLLRQVKHLEKSLASMTEQRDKYRGKANEYKSYASKYQSELAAARRALRKSAQA